ncbi:hypothetical protein IJJ18_02875 [Candidatus Saccharibacteria bacterium]|nr:hypothetical protein [Candidatus Saccharibacteria bacterium]
MVHEERVVDVTKTLDKMIVWLLFGAVGVLVAMPFATHCVKLLPKWCNIVGLVVALVLLLAMSLLGLALSLYREEIYRWWFSRKATRGPNFYTLTGRIIDEIATEAGCEVVIRVDGSSDSQVRLSSSDSNAKLPNIGERITIVTAVYSDSNYRTLLRKTTLYLGASIRLSPSRDLIPEQLARLQSA